MEEIMIIEDDADLREILKFSLERAGYKTYEAESAENGLEMMNDRIRLILLDVMLPGMSGYELARVLREKDVRCPLSS
jgi:two-component system phosphate regulon response regulator PhoB